MDTPDSGQASRQPRPFLKRGEGVQKRVFAPLQKTRQPYSASNNAASADTVQRTDQAFDFKPLSTKPQRAGKADLRGSREQTLAADELQQQSATNTAGERNYKVCVSGHLSRSHNHSFNSQLVVVDPAQA